jgi:hypothetical protein
MRRSSPRRRGGNLAVPSVGTLHLGAIYVPAVAEADGPEPFARELRQRLVELAVDGDDDAADRRLRARVTVDLAAAEAMNFAAFSDLYPKQRRRPCRMGRSVQLPLVER